MNNPCNQLLTLSNPDLQFFAYFSRPFFFFFHPFFNFCMESSLALLRWKKGDCDVPIPLFPSIIFCSSFTILSNEVAQNNKREGK